MRRTRAASTSFRASAAMEKLKSRHPPLAPTQQRDHTTPIVRAARGLVQSGFNEVALERAERFVSRDLTEASRFPNRFLFESMRDRQQGAGHADGNDGARLVDRAGGV
jgi:hypothetical protein